ncbi:glycoside hydrolase family 17 protein [Dothistroma septosporum NZE10]|uniref:Glycoside hydrolase family 17 protein n=1 Tax=Dothistroma septosporum (strain NZE10 / CBS 128990) TaxID=675120 RepID=N1PCU9_DOTSN|nr:glycoside hydrolase family 17 protein [Dothistroma septosporum NZE10]
MKAGVLITGLALAASASAQIRHGHRHGHKERGDNVAYNKQVEVVTATAPNVIVYVDSDGKPISTSGAKASAYHPAPPAYTPAGKTTSAPAAPAYASPKSSSSAKAAPAYSASSSGSGSSSGQGITYSPYNADNSCKSAGQVKSDLAQISGYDLIRLYGSDCNQVANVLAACKTKLFVGVFDINNLQTESNTLIEQAKGSWDRIDTISIGNELVNGGSASVEQVVAAINTARGIFKAAGYTGSIVTVDTFVAMIANPGLCEASDYAAANCHAFFDGSKTADQAGAFVKDQAQRIASACGGKRVVITETGWPSQGETNGVAVPSKANQQTAISSLKSSFSKDIFLFSAFNDMWKTNSASTFGCEQFWGIY